MKMEYIILSDKAPIHKFKTSDTTKTWSQVKDRPNVGVVVPKGYLVLDFDTTEDAEVMLAITKALKLKTRVMKTTRGYHFWFKNKGIEKNFIKARLAIGIVSDCKNSNRRSYVKIKQDGAMREWVYKVPFDELEDVPAWLRPVSTPSDKFNFLGMGDGGGRNQELFNYIIYLQGKGFLREDIKAAIDVINNFVMADPLDEEEIAQITRSDAFKTDEEMSVKIVEQKGFKHNEFGDRLIDKYHLITVNGRCFVYEDGYYQQDERIIERKMIEMFPAIKSNNRNEVLSYIRIQTHKSREDIKVRPYIINLRNTRLDVRTGKKLPFSPSAIEFDRIPVTYDPDIYNADLDNMLKRVFKDDQEVLDLFDEMVGYCLLKHSRYRAGFMFTGTGKNGKSTIMDMLKHFLGRSNFTTIELDKLTDKFSTAELEDKLANIGDDINNRALKDTGTLKKLFTGESLLVERKGERPFVLEPYAKMIFSMNDIPQSYDKTDGFYSRLMFIPFNAKFEVTDEDFDPDIADKIMTDDAMSYLLNRALKGVNRLIARGGFEVPEVVRAAMDDYKRQNSIVLQWLQDSELGEEYLLSHRQTDIYSDFDAWCGESGIKAFERIGKIKFYKEVRETFNFDVIQRRDDNGSSRYFVVSLEF